MKAITILQPYASLIAIGAKRYETRGWKTSYRGPIAIHAGKNRDYWYGDCDKTRLRAFYAALKPVFYPDMMCNQTDLWDAAPYGAVIATAELVECWKIEKVSKTNAIGSRRKYGGAVVERPLLFTTTLKEYFEESTPNELLFGDWREGRYAWELANVKPLAEPVPARGRQGLWDWEENNV